MVRASSQKVTALVSSRKEKAEETRTRLVKVAAELFSERGYHETTVQEIAKRADVAKATFFVHFATKNALVEQIVNHHVNIVLKARADLLKRKIPAVEVVCGTIRALASLASDNGPLIAAVIVAGLENVEVGGHTDHLFSKIRDEMALDVKRAQKEGALVKSTPAPVIARALMGTFIGTVLPFTTMRGALKLEKELFPVVQAILRGFAA